MHDAPIKTFHWIKAPNYSCIMTGSWDKTLKFWDTRSQNPMMTITLPERFYCADVVFPMAVVETASRGIIVYQLEGQPQELKKIESPLKYQHRTVSIFLDKKNVRCGFTLGSVEGRVAIQYVSPQNPKDNFTFKCHRSNGTSNGYQDIYAVNGIAFHPVHNTLATVGSDGRFSFWDKDARTKLKTSEQMDQSIVKSCFDTRGEIFAYATSYDWSKPNTMATEKGKKEEKSTREMTASASVEMEVGSSTVTESNANEDNLKECIHISLSELKIEKERLDNQNNSSFDMPSFGFTKSKGGKKSKICSMHNEVQNSTVVEPETAAAQKCDDASILIENNVKQYNENERVHFSVAELQIKQELFNSFSAIPSFGSKCSPNTSPYENCNTNYNFSIENVNGPEKNICTTIPILNSETSISENQFTHFTSS